MKGPPLASADTREAEALLREGEGSGFAEPWQAEAFACTLQLSRQGLFPWTEWVEVFSTEIKAHPARPGESDNAAYYRQWLAALETLLARKGVASAEEIGARQEAWRQAYLDTPHGQPVELAHAEQRLGGGHHHHHGHGHHGHAAPKPVAIDPPVPK